MVLEEPREISLFPEFQNSLLRSEQDWFQDRGQKLVPSAEVDNLLKTVAVAVLPTLQNIPLTFTDVSLVSIRVRYLMKSAFSYGRVVIAAHGDCARSPNFFSASGVNIASHGLSAIATAWKLFQDNKTNITDVVNILNVMGEQQRHEIISEHENKFGPKK